MRLAWTRHLSFRLLKLAEISPTHSYYIYLQLLFFCFVFNFMPLYLPIFYVFCSFYLYSLSHVYMLFPLTLP